MSRNNVVSAQSVVAAAATRLWLTTPSLAWSFPCVADPEQWGPMFGYCNIERRPAADFEVGGRRYGVFGHDWRIEPPSQWLDGLAEREVEMGLTLDEIARQPYAAAVTASSFISATLPQRWQMRNCTGPSWPGWAQPMNAFREASRCTRPCSSRKSSAR